MYEAILQRHIPTVPCVYCSCKPWMQSAAYLPRLQTNRRSGSHNLCEVFLHDHPCPSKDISCAFRRLPWSWSKGHMIMQTCLRDKSHLTFIACQTRVDKYVHVHDADICPHWSEPFAGLAWQDASWYMQACQCPKAGETF